MAMTDDGGPSAARPVRTHPAHPVPLQRVNQSTIVFVTICVQGRRALLADPNVHKLLLSWWARADRWCIGRYVVMPDHVHLFCSPRPDGGALKHWISFWKNGVTRAWPGRTDDKPIWQKNFWDTQLRTGESYATKWEYVRQNPVRKGLVTCVDEWPYQGECDVLWWHEPA